LFRKKKNSFWKILHKDLFNSFISIIKRNVSKNHFVVMDDNLRFENISEEDYI